ncbi:hypothetical protein [Mycobacterium kansasii]|uniref:hypothetical protein n=1 Tax=Mycobacterium kansasii TaxID=1768 RepID=UPI000CDE2308|nr:hypothetical protein [Mycobacterium kansasii]POY30959.1 hypothetical protein C3478_19105 [Mycobacterium kansasii]
MGFRHRPVGKRPPDHTGEAAEHNGFTTFSSSGHSHTPTKLAGDESRHITRQNQSSMPVHPRRQRLFPP